MKKDLFEKMIEADSGFKAFVEAQKDKTTEEIATEFGISIEKIKNFPRKMHIE